MINQHTRKLREYIAFQNQPTKKPENHSDLFRQSTDENLFYKRSTTFERERVFTIDKANFEMIVQEFMLRARDNDDDGAEWTPLGDISMKVFEPY